MPNEKAYTAARPALTMEEKLEKGWLKEQMEESVARFDKLPKWKQDMLLARLEYDLREE